MHRRGGACQALVGKTAGAPWRRRTRAALGVAALVLAGKIAVRDRSITTLQHQLTARALDPTLSTCTVTIAPSRSGPPAHSLATIGAAGTEMADLKFDLSWTTFNAFRVIIDRIDQGRVGVIYNAMRDSNGVLHLGLNSSALGPGDYLLTIQGLTWRGEPVPTAWATVTIAR